MRIQRNLLIQAIGREPYAFYDYNTKHLWGEDESVDKMPVMTYAGFGTEIRKASSQFNWHDYNYIICDEMQNLVGYQRFDERSTNLEKAEDALRKIAAEKSTIIIAMSATPQKIRERFGALCYDVPIDKDELISLSTFASIPYKNNVEQLLLSHKGKTGILFTTNVRDMKYYIEYANYNGIMANGFWSTSVKTQKEHPHTPEQTRLREKVLCEETIPNDVDLLVINRSSETCIKIQEKKRKVDFMIVHNCNEEIKTQVRGRYNGDLDEFFYHDIAAANLYQINATQISASFFGKRLYSEDQQKLFRELNLRTPAGYPYGKDTVFQVLSQCGYQVSESKKDSKNHGRYYRVITPPGYQSE